MANRIADYRRKGFFIRLDTKDIPLNHVVALATGILLTHLGLKF